MGFTMSALHAALPEESVSFKSQKVRPHRVVRQFKLFG